MDAVTSLMTQWATARAALADLEHAGHPDITDSFGRVWTWKGRGDLYTHCGSAIPRGWVAESPLPPRAVLNNPNYDICAVCLAGRERNVPDCKPEWYPDGCPHAVHQR